MTLFERILVPTDMSEFSDLALRYALLFHDRLGSNITMLHAEKIASLADSHPMGYYIENERESRSEARNRLGEFARRATPESARVATLFADDSAPHAIVAAARDTSADLIVMSTHGRSGWSRMLMGSVAERVLREIEVPLLTVRPGLVTDVAIESVLCDSWSAVELASAIADAFGAMLVLGAPAPTPRALLVTGRVEAQVIRDAHLPVISVPQRKEAARGRLSPSSEGMAVTRQPSVSS